MKRDGFCGEADCSRAIEARGLCKAHYLRAYKAGVRKPADELTYGGAHGRVRRERGPAREYVCVDCGDAAQEWSYDGLDPNEMTERGRAYSRDPDHYDARCKSCHAVFDGWHENFARSF